MEDAKLSTGSTIMICFIVGRFRADLSRGFFYNWGRLKDDGGKLRA